MHRLSRMRSAVGTVGTILKKVEPGKVDNSEIVRKTEPEQVITSTYASYHLVILCSQMVHGTRSASQAFGSDAYVMEPYFLVSRLTA